MTPALLASVVLGFTASAPSLRGSVTVERVGHAPLLASSARMTTSEIPSRWWELFMQSLPQTAPWDDFQWTFDAAALPTLDELRDSCYLVGEGGVCNLFLCPAPHVDEDDCHENEVFSAHYGQPMYLCRGGYALPAM